MRRSLTSDQRKGDGDGPEPKKWYYRGTPTTATGLSITEGENPKREHIAGELIGTAAAYHLFDETYTRINPPPDSGPDWWWTGKRWRKSPPRKPGLDREGIHLLAGLLFAALPWIAWWFGFHTVFWGLMAVQGMALVTFLAYEITEGWRIKDWAYRDIGGYLVGSAIPPTYVVFHILNRGWLNWY